MHYLQTWNETFMTSFQQLWFQFTRFLPSLVGALIVLIIGLIVAYALGGLVKKIMTYTRIDLLVKNSRSFQKLQENGIVISLSGLIAGIVRWFFIILTLMMVVNILRLHQVNNFLESIILYIPNIVVALIILAIGLALGHFAGDILRKSTKATTVSTMGNLLAAVGEWSIIIFSVMAALVQLGIASSLIQILFTGLVAAFSLALGLAFGLGGRDRAAMFLDEVEKKK